MLIKMYFQIWLTVEKHTALVCMLKLKIQLILVSLWRKFV